MTNPSDNRIVRPTMRCLLEDLAHEIGPEELRVALRSARGDMATDSTFMFPCMLTDAEHAVLDKANLLAGNEAAERERIAVLTDRFAIKVKTGDRRAALWQDRGTWWLLAAGHRKNDESGDFYREIARFETDASAIAPTEVDERYRRLELAYATEMEVERAAHVQVLQALLAAAERPGEAAEASVFGADVSITVDPDEGGLAVLEMRWEFLRFDEQDRFPHDVLAMVPGMASVDGWEYLPPRRDSDSPHGWFTYVPQAWIDDLATAVEIDRLLHEVGDWAPSGPLSDGSEHFSHYAGGEVVTIAYVTGIEFVALCGARVVAHRDYEKLPVCSICAENLALLRSFKKPEAP